MPLPNPSTLTKMSTYLVTGSSRGLGFSIVKHLAERPRSEVGTIFATSRQKNTAQLSELVEREKGRVQFVQLDAASQGSVEAAVPVVERVLQEQEQGRGLDVVINNAGVARSTRGGIVNMYGSFYLFCPVLVRSWADGRAGRI